MKPSGLFGLDHIDSPAFDFARYSFAYISNISFRRQLSLGIDLLKRGVASVGLTVRIRPGTRPHGAVVLNDNPIDGGQYQENGVRFRVAIECLDARLKYGNYAVLSMLPAAGGSIGP